MVFKTQKPLCSLTTAKDRTNYAQFCIIMSTYGKVKRSGQLTFTKNIGTLNSNCESAWSSVAVAPGVHDVGYWIRQKIDVFFF